MCYCSTESVNAILIEYLRTNLPLYFVLFDDIYNVIRIHDDVFSHYERWCEIEVLQQYEQVAVYGSHLNGKMFYLASPTCFEQLMGFIIANFKKRRCYNNV